MFRNKRSPNKIGLPLTKENVFRIKKMAKHHFQLFLIPLKENLVIEMKIKLLKVINLISIAHEWTS